MATDLFASSTPEKAIGSARMQMKHLVEHTSRLEDLASARSAALAAGLLQRPTIDRASAKFSQKERNNRVEVQCTLAFAGPSRPFHIKPDRSMSPLGYGDVSPFNAREKLVLIEFVDPLMPADQVKAKFRQLLDEIDARLDLVASALKQHNDTVPDQVDRLVETRRRELEGMASLRDGLSDGL